MIERRARSIMHFLAPLTLAELGLLLNTGWPGPDGSSSSLDNIEGVSIGKSSPAFADYVFPANRHDFRYELGRRLELPEAYRRAADREHRGVVGCRRLPRRLLRLEGSPAGACSVLGDPMVRGSCVAAQRAARGAVSVYRAGRLAALCITSKQDATARRPRGPSEAGSGSGSGSGSTNAPVNVARASTRSPSTIGDASGASKSLVKKATISRVSPAAPTFGTKIVGTLLVAPVIEASVWPVVRFRTVMSAVPEAKGESGVPAATLTNETERSSSTSSSASTICMLESIVALALPPVGVSANL